MSSPYSDDEKLKAVPNEGFSEVERIETVDPLPNVLEHDGGLIVDIKGLDPSIRVKLAKDGHTVLVPQPTGNEEDPLNWPWRKKHGVLWCTVWSSIVTDFSSAAGTAVVFLQAQEWHITPNQANYPGNLNVLMIGLGPLLWVPLASWWGRAPVVFWTTIIGFLFNIGSALTKDYDTFYAMRALSGFSLSAGQSLALALIKDMFFFHESARKIGVWGISFVAAPYTGPVLANFVVGELGKWRPVFWMCSGVAGLQITFLLLFLDETYYNRAKHHNEHPERLNTLVGRMLRLTGVWQARHHAGYFLTLKEAYRRIFSVLTNRDFLLIDASYVITFAWGIGINVSTALLFVTPVAAGGYGFSNTQLGYLYFTPIVAVSLGEIFGHFFNDFLTRRYIAKHGGLYEPESRLYMLYIAAAFMIPGLILIGQTLHKHLAVVAIVFGWGMHSFGLMLNSVAVSAYSLDIVPYAPAEVNGWLNFARVIGGFSVGYFQQPWVRKDGADVSFGVQAAIVGFSVIMIILAHVYGRRLRLKSTRVK